jgi:hypothetical protein
MSAARPVLLLEQVGLQIPVVSSSAAAVAP